MNKLDGASKHLLYDGGVPVLFGTRERARVWIMRHYGFIRSRPDLKSEPHGWRIPKPVRVTIMPNAALTDPAAKPKETP